MSKKNNNIPPLLPLKWFKWFCRPEYHLDIEGDLLELFEIRKQELGLEAARWLMLWDILLLFRPGIIRPLSKIRLIKHPIMLRHNLKISWRHLSKNKGYSFLNISGLVMGMTVAILIGLLVWDELTFNKNHQHYENVATVLQNQDFNGEIQTWWSQSKQLAPELRDNYGSNFKHVSTATWVWDHTLTYDETTLSQSGIFMESGAPEMLALNMLHGNHAGLTDPYSILLSESVAKALFGADDPMLKVIQLDDFPELTVTGIYEDLPSNSSFSDVLFMASWDMYEKDLPGWLGWGNSWFRTFVQIAENADMATVSAMIKDVKLNNAVEGEKRFKPELFLHPMSKWHLYSKFEQGVNTGGRIQYVWLYGIIGIFVLLLACINFINLSTARSEKRAKEVGIRKALGSHRRQIINQFFSESLLIVSLAFGLSLVAAQFLLPFFNEVAQKELNLLWSNPYFWLACLGFTVCTGILAGSYPALYLSSFQAVKVLKGTFQSGRFSALPRRVLVVVQFTVSVTLIIGTIIVFQQIQFAKNRPVGYNRSNLVNVTINSEAFNKHYEAFRNDLLQTGVVEEVAKSESSITQTWTTNSGLDWRGKETDMQDEFVTVRVTHEFGKTVGWQIKEGRDFSREFATDTMGFVINEAAVEYFGFENPIGEQIKWGEDETYTIIGVVKDMITQSPYNPTKQMIFFIDYDRTYLANIKISPNASVGDAVAKIKAVYTKYEPVDPFDYSFVDEEYARKFGDEERIAKLASFFAILAIFISCLGLFGMISFVAEKRTKEIGIRKILGASVANLWQMLSREYLILVILSSLIAVPIAYYFLQGWLENYVYHIDISVWVFLAAGLGALLITILTVSFQAIKAARANPVKSLRAE